MPDAFARDASRIGALDDEVRRRLYRYVVEQPAPVGRDQAAAALGLPRHTAKFHLDRLEDVGLLEADYRRLSGRTGPGAGRPAKTYRRAQVDITVTLPAREYGLAAELMARAITTADDDGTPVRQALEQAAQAEGQSMGARTDGLGTPITRARDVLGSHGYEPRDEGERLVMTNCPFHALRAAHTVLVCQMNHALVGGLCSQIGSLRAELEPDQSRCCVVISET